MISLVEDRRTPVETTETPSFDDRWKRGQVVAYDRRSNGEHATRGVVVAVDDVDHVVDVLDDAGEVTSFNEEALAEVVVLAESVDAYATRWKRRAETLSAEYGWCEVMRANVKELLNRPAPDDLTDEHVSVIVTVEGHFRLRPGRRVVTREQLNELISEINRRFFVSAVGSFDADYLVEARGTDRIARVSFELVDELPSES